MIVIRFLYGHVQASLAVALVHMVFENISNLFSPIDSNTVICEIAI